MAQAELAAKKDNRMNDFIEFPFRARSLRRARSFVNFYCSGLGKKCLNMNF